MVVSVNTVRLVREALAKRKRSQVRGVGLADSLKKAIGITLMDARAALNVLRDNKELSVRDWDPHLGPLSMVTLNLDIPEDPAETAWRSAMKNAGLIIEEINCLLPAANTLVGMTLSELEAVAKGLIKLRECYAQHEGQSRFLVSAHYLLGSSKLLDSLPWQALRAFGIDPAVFPDAPGYVMTAGPNMPNMVVLVENPQSFEMAVKSNVPGVAWVTTHGYGLSRGGDAFGEQLAVLIETGKMLALIRAGSPPVLLDLLNHPNLSFWGDLDPAGLHIYHRLKRKLPQLDLSALYYPMVEILKNGGGHPYVKATGKEGQVPQAIDDKFALDLLSLCEYRGVDQEVLSRSEICLLAGKCVNR